MSMQQFLIVWLFTLGAMLLSRVVPIFILKKHAMPVGLRKALNLIPPAAFAALVANDLFTPDALNNLSFGSFIPYIAALAVLIVARKTKSLIWCALTGVAVYALLAITTGNLS